MQKEANIEFVGGVDSVTGANFLLTLKEDKKETKILIDCGLSQGIDGEKENYAPFPYLPKEIDFLVVTHSHIDHIGKIPKLIKDGFCGKIWSTIPTKELSLPMLEDTAKIMLSESLANRKDPLFEEKDVFESFKNWEGAPYHTEKDLGLAVLNFKDAGHILGSAIAEISFADKKIVFTGDLGNSPSPIIKDTESVTGGNFLIMESVYGNKNHEDIEQRREKFKKALNEGIKKGGVILIPSFSLEKTQVILNELNRFLERGEIKSVPVFLDSPLAIKITDIYRSNTEYFNEETRRIISSGDDIFNFPKLLLTDTKKESIEIWNTKNPKIIIAGSGMSKGGRIVGHEKRYLNNTQNTIIFLGYQAIGTLGREIVEGQKEVFIDQEKIPVRAKIEKIDGYSSHKDSNNLLKFVESGIETLETVFVVMGEPQASSFLAERIKDELNIKAVCPKKDRIYKLL